MISKAPGLILDRMALDEVGRNSRRLAEEIRKQLGEPTSYLNIADVALALDIIEVKTQPLSTFEGALLTDPERSFGLIIANSDSGATRRRFTIAHELLHFLNDKHVQTKNGFRCRKAEIGDRRSATSSGMTRHLRQEAEANRFAIELLAPRASFLPHTSADPNLSAVVELARKLKFSKEACARRYLELHDARMALVFHHNGEVRYLNKGSDFTWLALSKGSPMPQLERVNEQIGLTDLYEDDAKNWFNGPPKGELSVQTLYQHKGYGITMLVLSRDEDIDEAEIEDTFDRYSRYG